MGWAIVRALTSCTRAQADFDEASHDQVGPQEQRVGTQHADDVERGSEHSLSQDELSEALQDADEYTLADTEALPVPGASGLAAVGPEGQQDLRDDETS